MYNCSETYNIEMHYLHALCLMKYADKMKEYNEEIALNLYESAERYLNLNCSIVEEKNKHENMSGLKR